MSKDAGKSPESTGKSAEVFVMNAGAEAHALVCEIASPLGLGDKIKCALARVARHTGLSERRVRGLYHREARAIRAEELDALRREAKRRRAEESARAEYRDAISVYRAALYGLAQNDPDFASAMVDPLGAQAPAARPAHRAVDRAAGGLSDEGER